MTTYGRTIEYTSFDGCKGAWSVTGCKSKQELREATLKFVKNESNNPNGWTQPKWWQWWRWNDTRLDNEYLIDFNNTN